MVVLVMHQSVNAVHQDVNVGRSASAFKGPLKLQEGFPRVQLVVLPQMFDYNFVLRHQKIGILGTAWSEPIFRSPDGVGTQGALSGPRTGHGLFSFDLGSM